MSLQPGQEITLVVEKAVAGGRMLARHEGQVVFVAGAIPGERVRARVAWIAKQVAFATTTEVLDPSADRRSIGADWSCGGSFYLHINYDRQLSLKSELVADSFARIAKVRLDRVVGVCPSAEVGYRMRARLHVADGSFGFFREGTHELCDAAATTQLLPATIEALDRLEHGLRAAGVADRVKACEVSENATATERAILLEMDSPGSPVDFDPIDGITGLMFADSHRARLTVGFGSPYVTDTIGSSPASATLSHHVQSFFQGNRYLLAELVNRVLAHVRDGQVTELYAGVGLFAVSLAASGFRRIVAVEGDRSSVRDLMSNAARYEGALSVEQTSVEGFFQRAGVETPDTIVLDPPRTGISREAMTGILGLASPAVVYLSCDLATLARDVRRFLDAGYALDHIEAFDLFPNTAHVETLVVLSRSRPT
jgi:tRNA/tmRNA/rRNA uracil-C5-methylase (TrmA/RlmC/RlmD family)